MNNFTKFYSGLLYDTMRFVLKYKKSLVFDKEIRPIWNFKGNIFGKAFTCKGREIRYPHFINDNIRLEMLENLIPNTIMVYDTGNHQDVAHFGDLTALIAKKHKCLGAILNGGTRDVNEIEKIKFPVFCRYISPIDSYGHWQVESYQEEIQINGIDGYIQITPNDYIFADRDGIIFIPNELINDLYIEASKRLKSEQELRKKIYYNYKINLLKEYQNRGIH